MKIKKRYISFALGALGCILFGMLVWGVEEWLNDSPTRMWSEIEESNTLRVGTLRTSISAYQYKGRWHGHEYDVVAQVTSELGLNLDLHLMESEKELLDSLASGHIDLVAWPTCFRLLNSREGYRPCGYAYPMEFCTLSNRKLKISPNDSARYSLAVVEGSRPWFLLRDSAFCAAFDRKAFAVDTIPAAEIRPEQLVESIVAGKYDATLVACNVGRLMTNYYQTLCLGKPIGCSSDSVSWMVAWDADTLAAKIDSICRFDYPIPEYTYSSKYFYMMANKNLPGHRSKRKSNGSLTGFDPIFREYADSIGWDWRMLAALSMHESGCRNNLVSPKGARGIMQIMPETAARMGCPKDSMMDVRLNVRTASRILRRLEKALRGKMATTKDSTITSYQEADSTLQAAVNEDLLWFTLASYNCGLGHVFDAINMAKELGYDPAVWQHNVEHCLRLKVLPAYYQMPCVRLGRFNAATTVRYAHDVADLGEAWIAEDVKPVASMIAEEDITEQND